MKHQVKVVLILRCHSVWHQPCYCCGSSSCHCLSGTILAILTMMLIPFTPRERFLHDIGGRHPTTNQLAKAISCYPACIVVDPLLTRWPLKWPTAAPNKETTDWGTLGSDLEMLLEANFDLSDVLKAVASTAFWQYISSLRGFKLSLNTKHHTALLRCWSSFDW